MSQPFVAAPVPPEPTPDHGSMTVAPGIKTRLPNGLEIWLGGLIGNCVVAWGYADEGGKRVAYAEIKSYMSSDTPQEANDG